MEHQILINGKNEIYWMKQTILNLLEEDGTLSKIPQNQIMVKCNYL